MSFLDLFRRRTQDVFYTRVLVCSLGDLPVDELDRDFSAYQRYLGSVTLQRFADASGLVNAFRDRYDIVHVLTPVTVDGRIGDSEISGTELIQQAALNNTKLLWIASSNDPKGYIKGFKANGNKLNVVMTVDRRGDCMSNFIGKLLHEMQSGLSMPVAWNKIAPQIPGPEHPDAPATIFYCGLGQVRFV
jgi:hypothetical protein